MGRTEWGGGGVVLEETTQHINYLELLAIFLALKTFAKDLNQCTILCRSDYVTAMTYLNQKGGVHSEVLCNLALEIWEWCLSRGITVVAEHLPGLDSQPGVEINSRPLQLDVE